MKTIFFNGHHIILFSQEPNGRPFIILYSSINGCMQIGEYVGHILIIS